MLEIKGFSVFQGNPQSSDEKPDFWNRFTEDTQGILCTSNVYLKKPETKKAKKEERNLHSNHYPSVMKEQLTMVQEQNKNRKIVVPGIISEPEGSVRKIQKRALLH